MTQYNTKMVSSWGLGSVRHGRSVGNQDISALQQGMYLFTRLALEGLVPLPEQ